MNVPRSRSARGHVALSHSPLREPMPLFGEAPKMPAIIGHAAPAFSAGAVMPDGSFKTVSLSDFKGARGSSACATPSLRLPSLRRRDALACRQVRRPVLLPAGLHVCVPGAWLRAEARQCWAPEAQRNVLPPLCRLGPRR